MQEDQYAKGKYEKTANDELKLFVELKNLQNKKNVSMTEISLAWLMQKVTSPIVGATKKHHIDDAIRALDVTLNENEICYLEELYVPHRLVGVMAENKL